MGVAIGAALSGLRPVVEIMFVDFITLAMDQLVNHAAKLHYMSGGQLKVPLTVRVQCGVQGNMGAHHSQSLESWFLHVPGLKVVMPSNPADAESLMRDAIRDDNPVLFIEHRGAVFFPRRGARGWQRPRHGPGGGAPGRRRRDRGRGLQDGGAGSRGGGCADGRGGFPWRSSTSGASCRWTVDTLVGSVRKTVAADRCARGGGAGRGLGAEVAARVQEQAFYYLDSPVLRVAAPNAPVPCAPPLENAFVPDRERIVQAVHRALSDQPG